MFLTTHAAAGIFISHYISNPYEVFGLSFASHFVLDFIPHGDEHLYHDHEWRILKQFKRPIIINSLDLIGLTAVIFWAIYHPGDTTSRLMMVGIIGSILPDFLSYLFPILHERLSWLFLVRWLYRLTKPTGLRYLVRGQNWIHNVLHHKIIRSDIPFVA
ncbi:MAG: hypothetical protein HY975_02015, partial [Candidatus Kerfeldbacteria bacterium]|nr:hypothetical protein [Candidatus Kerfeldbacteria bacterium]